MESSDKDQGQKNIPQVQIFSVPFALRENQGNITFNTNTSSKPSKEQIINQALKFHSQGNIPEAAKLYQYCINQGFNDHRVFSNYGIILKDLGKLQNAEFSYRKAIELEPDFADAHYNLGNILRDLGKSQEAELSYRKAIEINPDFVSAHLNLGNILRDLGRLEEAELYLRQAIELKFDFAEAHSNLGNILRDLGKLKEAEISIHKAIELDPNFPEYYNILGTILRTKGNIKDATESFDKALNLNPNLINARKNLANLKLLSGDYKSGWYHNTWRWKEKNSPLLNINVSTEKWKGNIFKKGDKLLVFSEEGLGHTIQYMRFIPFIRRQGVDISFVAEKKLHGLIQASRIDQCPLTFKQSVSVSEGRWIPLLSIAGILGVSPEKPIISTPYIYTKDKLVKKWENIINKDKRLIIGINWQGNPKLERTQYRGRSIALEDFSSLLCNNHMTMLSLQKGFGSEQLEHCSFKNKFIECQPQIDSTWDFLENAAIIHNCDLIITSDTSIAHLAGGIGKKVWLLLQKTPEWRWGLKGESTFWYPSMKLFRQKERHNWQEVIERVSNKLRNKINAQS